MKPCAAGCGNECPEYATLVISDRGVETFCSVACVTARYRENPPHVIPPIDGDPE